MLRCWNALRSRGGDPPRITDFALADLGIGCAYTLFLLVSIAWHDSWIGHVTEQWLHFTGDGVEIVLFFLPDPNLSFPPDMVSRVLAYRHLQVACAIVTLACITFSRPYWATWSREFVARLRSSGAPAPRFSPMILTAHRNAVVGMAAAIFLLLFAEPRSGFLAQFLYGSDFAFFRVPLLLALICFLACHVAMLRSLLPAQDDD